MNTERRNRGEGAGVHALVHSEDQRQREREHVNRKQDMQTSVGGEFRGALVAR